MARDARAYLWDMRDAAQQVLRFTAGVSLAEYLGNDMLRSAVERQMQNLGEALAQLTKIEPELAARVHDRAQIVGLRNVLVHGYATLNHARVWETIESDLPALQKNVDALLAHLGPPA